MRERPLRNKGPKPKVEMDDGLREASRTLVPVPDGPPEFKEGFRECLEFFALHRPNKRGVARILDEQRLLLEEACMRAMTRENVARYEGYQACLKALRQRRILK